MRRDLDYMRQILAEMEESDEWLFHMLPAQGKPLKVEPRREYCIRLLADQGFITQEARGIFRMTGRGHDFLENTRDVTVWERTKRTAEGAQSYSLALMAKVAEGYVRAKLSEVTGLDLT